MDYEGRAPDRFDDLLASSIAFEADSLSCEDDLMWSRCLAWWERLKTLSRLLHAHRSKASDARPMTLMPPSARTQAHRG